MKFTRKSTKFLKLFLLAFTVITLTCFAVSSRYVSYFNYYEEEVDSFFQSNRYLDNFSHRLHVDDFFKCNVKSLNSILNVTSSRDGIGDSEEQVASLSSSNNDVIKSHSFFHMVESFSRVVSTLDVKMAIVEPSILFCLLPPVQRESLLKRKFNFTGFSGDDSHITFAVLAKDANQLEKDEIQETFRIAGFAPSIVKVPLLEWMKTENVNALNSTHFVSHIFYQYEKYIVHVVVFHRRQHYLWHASVPSSHSGSLQDSNKVMFADYDSAYDDFRFVPVNVEKLFPGSIFKFSIPSEPQLFLFQIYGSRFLECNQTRVAEFNKAASSTKDKDQSPLSVAKFNKKTHTALRQLKLSMNKLLMHWWIWSGTMLGWYRQCGVIPYTSDVDTGAWAEEVDDFDVLHSVLGNNTHFKIRERYGMVQQGLEFNLNCHGLRLDVFFLYPEKNGTWYAGHRPSKGYYFKYHHPNFALCSGELLGERVPVPCEAEKCIVAEYGPEWMKPVTGWNYETSIWNRGPNIYWPNKLRNKTYKDYY